MPAKSVPRTSKAKRSRPQSASNVRQALCDQLSSWLPGMTYVGSSIRSSIDFTHRSSLSLPSFVRSPATMTHRHPRRLSCARHAADDLPTGVGRDVQVAQEKYPYGRFFFGLGGLDGLDDLGGLGGRGRKCCGGRQAQAAGRKISYRKQRVFSFVAALRLPIQKYCFFLRRQNAADHSRGRQIRYILHIGGAEALFLGFGYCDMKKYS